jgi:hypothetical protein
MSHKKLVTVHRRVIQRAVPAVHKGNMCKNQAVKALQEESWKAELHQ